MTLTALNVPATSPMIIDSDGVNNQPQGQPQINEEHEHNVQPQPNHQQENLHNMVSSQRSGVIAPNPGGEDVVVMNNEINGLAAQSKQPQPEGEAGNPEEPGQPHADPGLIQALNQFKADLNAGHGQAENFAANHQVASGRDWDFSDDKGMREVAENSYNGIRKCIQGKVPLEEFSQNVAGRYDEILSKLPDSDLKHQLKSDFLELRNKLDLLEAARNDLIRGMPDDFSSLKEPIDVINKIKKNLRVFRYETQTILSSLDPEHTQKMGFWESGLRAIQNTFTFGVDHHVKSEDIELIFRTEQDIQRIVNKINEKLTWQNQISDAPLKLPDNFTFASTIHDTLEISHRTNEQIRRFMMRDPTAEMLKDMLSGIAQKGGKRKVEFTAGLGALIGLGFPKSITAGLKAGLKLKITGDIDVRGADKPLNVTYRIAGGLEAKLIAQAGDDNESLLGLKAEAGGSAMISSFTTRSYATLADLIADCDRCGMATSRTIGAAVWGRIKSIGSFFGNLGVKLFSYLGRHPGEVQQNNEAYLASLKDRGMINKLDGILAKRANPMIVAERKGYTGHLQAQANASVSAGIAKLKATTMAEHQRDFKVKSQFYVPIARMIRAAPDDELANLIRPDEDVQESLLDEQPDELAILLDEFDDPGDLHEDEQEPDLETKFADLIHRTQEQPPETDVAWAKFANQIRTLMINVEQSFRAGEITRAEADRLLTRFSNPEIKMPPEIFREYLMEGSKAAKPGKQRNTVQFSFKMGFLTTESEDLTSGLSTLTNTAADSFIKATADGAVQEARHQIGLDTTIKYTFTSEKPLKGSTDPRPWENMVKTSHEFGVTASTPCRVIIDMFTKIQAAKHSPLDKPTQEAKDHIAKDLAKDISKDAASYAFFSALPGLLIAGVKESAKAAVIKWLDDPEHVKLMAKFIVDHAGEAFDVVLSVAEWAAKHPDTVVGVFEQIKGYQLGSQSLSDHQRNKLISLNFIDGELESVAIKSEQIDKLGGELNPLGVGIGVGLDLSYSVTQIENDGVIHIHPKLKSLLSRTEDHLFADTSVIATNAKPSLKHWLAKNIVGIRSMVAGFNTSENHEMYQQALDYAEGNEELVENLRTAWDKFSQLKADSPANEVVDATCDLLVAMTYAFREALPEAA